MQNNYQTLLNESDRRLRGTETNMLKHSNSKVFGINSRTCCQMKRIANQVFQPNRQTRKSCFFCLNINRIIITVADETEYIHEDILSNNGSSSIITILPFYHHFIIENQLQKTHPIQCLLRLHKFFLTTVLFSLKNGFVLSSCLLLRVVLSIFLLRPNNVSCLSVVLVAKKRRKYVLTRKLLLDKNPFLNCRLQSQSIHSSKNQSSPYYYFDTHYLFRQDNESGHEWVDMTYSIIYSVIGSCKRE